MHSRALAVAVAACALPVLFVAFFVVRKSREKHSTTYRRRRDYFVLSPDVKVIYTADTDECNEAVKCFAHAKVLGVDAEWSSKTSNGRCKQVALLQISDEHTCVLAHVAHMKTFPERLKTLLEDESVFKSGVAIRNDASRTFKEYDVLIASCVDLQAIVSASSYTCGLGLHDLAVEFAGIHLNKDRALTCCDWQSKTLTDSQKHYAAVDAWVSCRVLWILHQRLADGAPVEEWCAQFVNSKPVQGSSRGTKSKPTKFSHENGSKFHIRKKLMYENCQIKAPTGELLCCCDEKKVAWYLERDLAVREPDGEGGTVVIRLNFQPAGMGHHGENYYLAEKPNSCVVCGADHSYLRHYVVPRGYRQYFPERYKSHTSHDIVLLCQNCHAKCSAGDDAMRQKIADEMNAPLSGNGPKSIQIPELVKVRAAASTLLKNKGGKLPSSKVSEFRELIADYFGIPSDELSEEKIREASQLPALSPNTHYRSHEEIVVGKLLENTEVGDGDYVSGELALFLRKWRQHFMDTMHPQNLPRHWSVHHRLVI